MENENCGDKKLQFFSTYTREACVMEDTFKFVRQNCSCWPYQVKKHLITDGNANALNINQ